MLIPCLVLAIVPCVAGEVADEKSEALEFLYTNSALPDITDHHEAYFVDNVNVTMQAREEMPWGKTVPEEIFRHFVLPIRVNNESLDDSRRVFYNELRPRVKDLSMEDAILEVNHWCHEKATYQPSDGRTHNPLATVYTAIGRCGEESTFLVAALRAVGIPARQIYTPRWAHTDDNHAWVEAWASGKWYFLGACEPEAVLNLGWFNAPASRGMLMSARVIGDYNGPEEVLFRESGYTNINATDHYAPVDTLRVQVIDAEGKAVAGADVDFCLYNYAEYYPLVSKRADEKGRASLVTGLGDLVVWASKDGKFGYTHSTTGNGQVVDVVLDKDKSYEGVFEFDFVPPAEGAKKVKVTPEAQRYNDLRKAREDSIRAAYEATFMTAEQAAILASELSLDTRKMQKIMADARGNHAVLKTFLESYKDTPEIAKAFKLLGLISKKDRSDVAIEVLRDHMGGHLGDTADFVLNPRVSNEFLTEYRRFFQSQFEPAQAAELKSNPSALVKLVAERVAIVPDWNPSTVHMSPRRAWETRKTDKASRDIMFVAMARSLGIPARIDPVTARTQWMDTAGAWVNADFETPEAEVKVPQGRLLLDFDATGRIDNPEYYTHFTISKITDEGYPTLLNFDEGSRWAETFSGGVMLDEGQYLLTTGQRLANGSVLASSKIFTVREGQDTNIALTIRQDASKPQVIGSLNAEDIYHDLSSGTDKSLLSTTGRGYYILGLITPNHEPSNHALRDIAKMSKEFEAWGRPMMLLFADEAMAKRFDASQLPQLPSTAVFGTDINGAISGEIIENIKLQSAEAPVFVIADTFNRIVFVSQGYTINLGETLIDTIHKLD